MDIQEYTTITLRIEDILTKLKAYLDGSYNPDPAPAMETETPINDPAAYEEIKNFVDSQGGMI